MRTYLSSATTFYLSPSGSDATGDGSQANPWATPRHAYDVLQRNYDLGGQTVTIQLANGTYPVSNQLYGPLVGQYGAGGLIFQGNSLDRRAVRIRPTVNTGYCFSADSGAAYKLKDMILDMTDGCVSTFSSADQLSVGFGSRVIIGEGIEFGNNLNPWNNVSIFGGYVHFESPYYIRSEGFVTTGDFQAGGNTITNVANASQIKRYMGIVGSYIPYGCYVESVQGSTVVCGFIGPVQGFTGTVTGSGMQFDYGGQCHIDLGSGGQADYATNGDPSVGFVVQISGFPYFNYAIFSNSLSSINVQAINWRRGGESVSVLNCRPFAVRQNATIDTDLQGVPYLPGTTFSNPTTSFNAGVTSIEVSSAVGITVGDLCNGVVATTATLDAGSLTVSVASASNIAVGNRVIGDGIPAGCRVAGINGTTITLDYPTTAAKTNSKIYFKGTGVPIGTVVTSVNGTTIGLSRPTTSACSNLMVYFDGLIEFGGQFA